MEALTEVKNAERLLRKLRRMPQVAREMIRDAMADQADEMVAMMKRLAPVDQGDLRDSIQWKWGRRAPKGAMALATVQEGEGDLAITIFTTDFKARWQEFGTVKMAANPFFFVAYRAQKKSARRAIQAAARRAAKKVAAGG